MAVGTSIWALAAVGLSILLGATASRSAALGICLCGIVIGVIGMAWGGVHEYRKALGRGPLSEDNSTPVDDVAAGDYWTAAINWAASAQVVNGYEGTSLFDPEANITREAFASMLANYAKATKDYVAPTTDISGMPGADGVSGWALENVQWAVENGIMGNNGADLNAQGTITRAEVAAMVMNFTEKF